MSSGRDHSTRIASCLIAAAGLLLVLHLHLLAALLAGLLVYEVIDTLTPQLQRMISGERARWLAVALLAVVVIGLLVLLVIGIVVFFRSDAGSPTELYKRMMTIIDEARAQLPHWIDRQLPASSAEVQRMLTDWLGRHTDTLQLAGKETVRVIVQLLVGMVLGALVALHAARSESNDAPLARALSARCEHLSTAFHNIVFAQVRISLLNTVLTGLFVLVGLPLAGIHLPLAKTLVLLTFVFGLLPVIGNLISNSLIVLVALSMSVWVALAALIFLIAIHKFEYFLNAHIVGTRIRAHAWEILLAMLAMEAAFGLPGVVAAPIYYAYLKRELKATQLI